MGGEGKKIVLGRKKAWLPSRCLLIIYYPPPFLLPLSFLLVSYLNLIIWRSLAHTTILLGPNTPFITGYCDWSILFIIPPSPNYGGNLCVIEDGIWKKTNHKSITPLHLALAHNIEMGGSREQIYLIITFCWFHRHYRYIILICFVYNVQALNDTLTVSVIITNSINCSFAHLSL